MHFKRTILALGALALSSGWTLAQSNDTPELIVQTTFPDNAFSRVQNGHPNRVVFSISQPKSESDRLITLESITGAFLNRDRVGKKGYVMRNMTVTKYKSLPIKSSSAGQPLQVPFDFYPEFKPQDVGVEFRLIVNDGQTSKKHNIHAYTGTVTVVEPPKSWYDVQLLSLYVLLAGIVVATILWASQNFPGSRTVDKRKQRKTQGKTVSSSGSTVGTQGQPISPVASKSSAYDEDWIPEHHLKKTRGGATSPRPRVGRAGASNQK